MYTVTAFIVSCTQIISMDFTNTSPAQLGIIIADGGPHKNAALAALVQTAERADEAVRVAHAAVEAAVAMLRNNRYDLICACDCTKVGHQLNGEIGASDCPASPSHALHDRLQQRGEQCCDHDIDLVQYRHSTKWPCRSCAGRDWKAGMGLINCVMELYMIIGLIGNGTTLPHGITG